MRFGPTTRGEMPGPTRFEKTGSVRMRRPRKLMSTVECPRQLPVIALLDHSAGVGRSGAGGGGPRRSKMVLVRKRMRAMTASFRTVPPEGKRLQAAGRFLAVRFMRWAAWDL